MTLKKKKSKPAAKKAPKKPIKKMAKKTPAKASVAIEPRKVSSFNNRHAPARKTKQPPLMPLSQSDPTALEIIRRIRGTLSPTFMKLENQSAAHAKHATRGQGNHYDLKVVSEMFNGLSLLQRTHLVNSLFSDLYGRAIHALKLELKSPQETPLPEYRPPALGNNKQKQEQTKK